MHRAGFAVGRAGRLCVRSDHAWKPQGRLDAGKRDPPPMAGPNRIWPRVEQFHVVRRPSPVRSYFSQHRAANVKERPLAHSDGWPLSDVRGSAPAAGIGGLQKMRNRSKPTGVNRGTVRDRNSPVRRQRFDPSRSFLLNYLVRFNPPGCAGSSFPKHHPAPQPQGSH
jgi:hypothetical protein